MLADKQLPCNIQDGGIIYFDCDNLELPEFHQESHQIHLARFLSEAELDAFEALHGSIGAGGYEEQEFEGAFDSCWLNAGALSDAARAYLLSLRSAE